MDNLIITPGGDRIRIMGDETAAHLLSAEHLENTLRKLSEREIMPGAEAGGINVSTCADLSGWMASAREEELRALALDFEAEQRAIEDSREDAAA